MEVYLALDLMDCILARETPSRECYACAARIQFNHLLDTGAMEIRDNVFTIRMGAFDSANRILLEETLHILQSGDPARARTFAEIHGRREPVESLLDAVHSTSQTSR